MHAVDGGSIERTHVLDEEILSHEHEARVARGDIFRADDDIGSRASADHDRTAHIDRSSSQFLRTFLDRNGPGLLFLALSLHEADTRFHDGEEKQVEQCYE